MPDLPRPAAPAALLRYTAIRDMLRTRVRARLGDQVTDDNRYELLEALIDAAALVGHVGSVSFEVGLDQCFADRASLIGPMIRHGQAVGLSVRGYQPAVVDLLVQLVTVPSGSATPIPAAARFATEADAEGASVAFRAVAAVSVADVNTFDARHLDESTGTYVDVTADLRSVGGSSVAVLPAVPVPDDLLEISWPAGQLVDAATIDVVTPASGLTFRWSYYNGKQDKWSPYEVNDMGGGQIRLRFDLPAGWGDPEIMWVRAELGLTGAYQDVRTIAYSGGFALELAAAAPSADEADGYLGQSSPSLDPSAYYLSMEWIPLPDVVDGTSELTVDGEVTWTIPDSVVANRGLRWRPGQTDDPDDTRRSVAAVVLTSAAPVVPVLESVDTSTGSAYVVFPSIQGTLSGPIQIGTHGGGANESITFGTSELLFEGATIQVDEGGGYVTWQAVDHLLNSDAGDSHVIVRRSAGDAGGWEAVFGDGVTGRIPAAASPVAVTYATDGDLDGNVGAHQVVVNADGTAEVAAVYNPSAATGWQAAEGSDDESLEDLRQRVLAEPRRKHAPITLGDYEGFAIAWEDAQGASPVARAFARMHSTDPKVIIVVVVGGGGAALPTASITALADYFNDPSVGVVLVNHRVDVANFTPRVIAYTLTVQRDGVTWTGLDPQLASAIRRWSNADSDEGDQKRFSPGGVVYRQKLLAWLEREFPILRGERYVMALAAPAADVTLGGDELPSPGVITINGVVY